MNEKAHQLGDKQILPLDSLPNNVLVLTKETIEFLINFHR